MASRYSAFAGPVSDRCERSPGSVITDTNAVNLAGRIAPHAYGPVLEIACGAGTVTSQLRSLLDPGIRLVATDMDESVLGGARRRLNGAANIQWKQATPTALPFDDSTFSAAACQFGLMFWDKLKAFREVRRVLMPGGLMVFSFWDRQTYNPFARIAEEAIAALLAGDEQQSVDAPADAGRYTALRDQLASSGFIDIEIEPIQQKTQIKFAPGLDLEIPVNSPLHLVAMGGDQPFHSEMQAVVVTARACR